MSKIKLSVLAGIVALGVALVAPADVSADCAFCRQTGGTSFACDGESGAMKCKGMSLGLCVKCDMAQTSLPARLAPDGSLNALYDLDAAEATGTAVASLVAGFDLEELEGRQVIRSECSGAILLRDYTVAAVEKMQQDSQIITI